MDCEQIRASKTSSHVSDCRYANECTTSDRVNTIGQAAGAQATFATRMDGQGTEMAEDFIVADPNILAFAATDRDETRRGLDQSPPTPRIFIDATGIEPWPSPIPVTRASHHGPRWNGEPARMSGRSSAAEGWPSGRWRWS